MVTTQCTKGHYDSTFFGKENTPNKKESNKVVGIIHACVCQHASAVQQLL